MENILPIFISIIGAGVSLTIAHHTIMEVIGPRTIKKPDVKYVFRKLRDLVNVPYIGSLPQSA